MRELKRQLAALDEKIENEKLYEEVLCDLRSLVIWHDDNVEVVWRLGRACFKNAVNVSDQAQKELLLQEGIPMFFFYFMYSHFFIYTCVHCIIWLFFFCTGIQACERVLDVEHADLHKWYALMIGSRTEYLPIKEKLESGHRFEKHVKKALSLRPMDSTLHHLIGRFKYTVSSLTWIEKKVNCC